MSDDVWTQVEEWVCDEYAAFDWSAVIALAVWPVRLLWLLWRYLTTPKETP